MHGRRKESPSRCREGTEGTTNERGSDLFEQRRVIKPAGRKDIQLAKKGIGTAPVQVRRFFPRGKRETGPEGGGKKLKRKEITRGKI